MPMTQNNLDGSYSVVAVDCMLW